MRGKSFAWLVVAFLVVMMVISLIFAVKCNSQDDYGRTEYQKDVALGLCDENAELAESLESLELNNVTLCGQRILTPPKEFYRLIKDKVLAGEIRGGEIAEELRNDNEAMIAILSTFLNRQRASLAH